MPSIPPQEGDTRGRKRPWYLVVALVLVSLAGVTAAADGCAIVGYYRGALPMDAPIPDGVSEADAELIRDSTERLKSALDQDKKVVFPMAASGLVLGMAMFAFAAAAMAGRDGARRAVTQLVAVRAVVLGVELATTRHVREADEDLHRTRTIADIRASHGSQAAKMIADQEAFQKRWGRNLAIGGVAIKILAFGLVVVALTRQRTRQFYEAAGEALADD
jgi:hypothetical protein